MIHTGVGASVTTPLRGLSVAQHGGRRQSLGWSSRCLFLDALRSSRSNVKAAVVASILWCLRGPRVNLCLGNDGRSLGSGEAVCREADRMVPSSPFRTPLGGHILRLAESGAGPSPKLKRHHCRRVLPNLASYSPAGGHSLCGPFMMPLVVVNGTAVMGAAAKLCNRLTFGPYGSLGSSKRSRRLTESDKPWRGSGVHLQHSLYHRLWGEREPALYA